MFYIFFLAFGMISTSESQDISVTLSEKIPQPKFSPKLGNSYKLMAISATPKANCIIPPALRSPQQVNCLSWIKAIIVYKF